MRPNRAMRIGALLLALALPLAPLVAQDGAQPVMVATGEPGLVPVRTEAAKGRILVTLPRPAGDGVALRLLYSTSLRTGLGSALLALDRGRIGNTQLLAFRRIGGKIAAQFENPRFRAASSAVANDFGISTVWLTDIAETLPDGRVVIDLAHSSRSNASALPRWPRASRSPICVAASCRSGCCTATSWSRRPSRSAGSISPMR